MKATFFSLLVLLVFVSACNQQKAGIFKDGDLLLTDANFDQEVLQSTEPVLVDFSATWCGPCQQLAPTIEELAVEYRGRVKVGKLDIDQSQAVPQKYGVSAIPALLVFKNGEVVDRVIGVQSKDKLAMMLNDALQSK